MVEETPALVQEKKRLIRAYYSTQLRRYVIVGVYQVEVPEDVDTESEAYSMLETQTNYSLLTSEMIW